MANFTERSGAVRVTVRLPGGERKTATFDTRPQAEAWASEMERKKAVGLLKASAGSSIKVEDLFDAYNVAVASKQDSARWNDFRIAKWGLDPLARMKLASVTTHDINEWITRRLKEVSGSTVNRELNLMSACFTYAVKDRRWLTENPCHGARRPADNPPRGRRLLTPKELETLAHVTGYESDPRLVTIAARVGACFFLALETGMRSGEILRLRPVDIDKDNRVAHVAALAQGGRKGARSGARAASRNVPLTPRALELIEQLLLAKPEGDYIVGLTDRQRDANWRKLVKMAAIDDLNFHDSKHEAATRLSRYLDVLELSHALGTKDVRLLRDTYYNNDAARAAKRLPDRLTP